MSKIDAFRPDANQWGQLQNAMNRPENGPWDAELLHRLSQGDTMGLIRKVLLGQARVIIMNQTPKEKFLSLRKGDTIYRGNTLEYVVLSATEDSKRLQGIVNSRISPHQPSEWFRWDDQMQVARESFFTIPGWHNLRIGPQRFDLVTAAAQYWQ